MIVNFIINFFLMIVSGLFQIFPNVTIASIPYIGPGAAAVLASASGVWRAVFDTIPYLNYSWGAFLYVVLPFEMLLLVLKVFLGSRTPYHDK